MIKPRNLLLALAGLLLSVVIACGGSSDKSADKKDSGAKSGGGSSNGQVLDLSKSSAKLLDLRSFRFDLVMKLDLGSQGLPTGSSSSGDRADALGSAFAAALLGVLGDIKADGSFIKPDQMDIKLKLGGQDINYIQIGQKAWVKFAGSWQTTSPDSSMGLGSSPTDLFGEFLPQEALKGAKTSKETVNGVSTTHYAFDKAALAKLSEFQDATNEFKDLTSANLDAWLSDEGLPVKLSMNLAGKDASGQKMGISLEMNVRDINSNSIQIKAPI